MPTITMMTVGMLVMMMLFEDSKNYDNGWEDGYDGSVND